MVNAWRWVKGKVPPMTGLFTLLMLLAYMHAAHLECLLQPQTFLASRALLFVFYHKSSLHLFVNMIWMLNKGAQLEKLHGSWCFFGTTTLMIFLSQGFTLLIYFPYAFFKNKWSHVIMSTYPQLNSYTLGFSGVLFALHFLLLVTSSLSPSKTNGLLISSHHHGSIIEGLFLLASLQTLIMPDSHFLNNICGIVSGFVYISIPCMLKVLMKCVMIIHNKALYPMYHAMTKISKKFCIKSKGYYQTLFYDNPQGSQNLHTNNRVYSGNQGLDIEEEHGDEEEEGDDALDPTLQWECRRCLSKNGVFLSFCLYCNQLRTL